MPTLKDLYTKYYPKLIKVLPMGDAIFVARLYASKFLPGDAKEKIQAKATRAEKATLFLDDYIEKAFDDDDGSNPLFSDLLNLMENSDDLVLQTVARNIKGEL